MTSAAIANQFARSVQESEPQMCGRASLRAGSSNSCSMLAYSDAKLTPLPQFLLWTYFIFWIRFEILALFPAYTVYSCTYQEPAFTSWIHMCVLLSQYLAFKLYQGSHDLSRRDAVRRVVHASSAPEAMQRVRYKKIYLLFY